MDMTTVGSNIIAVTPVGMVLSVLLAALGMMLFPIFTVYVTNIIQGQQQKGNILGQGNFLPEDNDTKESSTTSEKSATASTTTSSAKS